MTTNYVGYFQPKKDWFNKTFEEKYGKMESYYCLENYYDTEDDFYKENNIIIKQIDVSLWVAERKINDNFYERISHSFIAEIIKQIKSNWLSKEKVAELGNGSLKRKLAKGFTRCVVTDLPETNKCLIIDVIDLKNLWYIICSIFVSSKDEYLKETILFSEEESISPHVLFLSQGIGVNIPNYDKNPIPESDEIDEYVKIVY